MPLVGTAPRISVPAGGGATHSYIGYNVVGGSNGNSPAAPFVIYKAVTLATDGYVTSIGMYVKPPTGNGQWEASVALLTDSAGSPAHVLCQGWNVASQPASGLAAWTHVGLGVWVPAGTYWLAWADNSGGTFLAYYWDTGSDKYASPSNYLNILDIGTSGAGTVTATTKKFSLRADFLAT